MTPSVAAARHLRREPARRRAARWFGPARADSLPLVRIGEDRRVVVTPAGAAVLRLTPRAGVFEGRMAWPAREAWRFEARPGR